MHIKKQAVTSLSRAVLLTLISTLAYATDTITETDITCESPCVPITAEATSPSIPYYVTYTDCKTKKEETSDPPLFQRLAGKKTVVSYCAAPNTEVWINGGTLFGKNEKFAHPPEAVGKGWDFTCRGLPEEPKCDGKPR